MLWILGYVTGMSLKCGEIFPICFVSDVNQNNFFTEVSFNSIPEIWPYYEKESLVAFFYCGKRQNPILWIYPLKFTPLGSSPK